MDSCAKAKIIRMEFESDEKISLTTLKFLTNLILMLSLADGSIIVDLRNNDGAFE